MAVGIVISRTDLDSAGLRRAAARSRDADAARRMLALALVLDAAWTAKPCATGFIATTISALRACRIVCHPAPSLGFRQSRRPRWRGWFARDRRFPNTAWCAGVGSTCRGRSRDGLACTWPNAAWARCCTAWAFAVCPLGRAIRVTTRRPRRHTKKFRRPRRRCDPRARARQADRTLVARRSAHRSARHADPSVGRTRQPTARAA